MEQLDYNLLFRWFVGLAIDAPVWDATVFGIGNLIEGQKVSYDAQSDQRGRSSAENLKSA